jgi:hypothetical protein
MRFTCLARTGTALQPFLPRPRPMRGPRSRRATRKVSRHRPHAAAPPVRGLPSRGAGPAAPRCKLARARCRKTLLLRVKLRSPCTHHLCRHAMTRVCCWPWRIACGALVCSCLLLRLRFCSWCDVAWAHFTALCVARCCGCGALSWFSFRSRSETNVQKHK